MAPEEDERYLTGVMVGEIDRFCRFNRIPGCSFLFIDPAWRREMIPQGFVSWLQPGYVWKNRHYKTFEDYLSVFNTNQRRNVKRERARLRHLGITIKTRTGDENSPDFFSTMYRFYVKTNDQFGPWSCKYLKRSFFDGLYDAFRHRILFTVAYREARTQPVGMSLLAHKGDRLYGRYWGCEERVRFLHFDTCYYSPIEWAIARGIRRFDPGIGGYHKIRRGFEALPNYSLRRFYQPQLRHLLQLHIDEINRIEREQINALNTQLPYAEMV